MRILLDDLGFDLSRRRVTLSTSGLVPQIYKLAEESNVALAVSLHAPDDELRNQLVPINRMHPIAELLEACWHYIDEQNGRSVTFEYVMLEGVNDSPAQARALARLLAGHPAKVNLIPFNPFPGTRYRRSAGCGRSRASATSCCKRGVMATMRRTRGDDIDAACGQLVGRVIDRTTVRLGASRSARRCRHERTVAAVSAALRIAGRCGAACSAAASAAAVAAAPSPTRRRRRLQPAARRRLPAAGQPAGRERKSSSARGKQNPRDADGAQRARRCCTSGSATTRRPSSEYRTALRLAPERSRASSTTTPSSCAATAASTRA